MPETLEQAQERRHQAVESNRDLGVIKYKSKQKQSDAVFEVEEGHHTLPDGQRLGPGQRFHPTESQVTGGKGGRSTLAGKAREVTRSEYRDLRQQAPAARVPGADIGIRQLPMADSTLKRAIEGDLTEADFAGLEPAFEGRFTGKQIEELIEKKNAARAD